MKDELYFFHKPRSTKDGERIDWRNKGKLSRKTLVTMDQIECYSALPMKNYDVLLQKCKSDSCRTTIQ